MKICPRCGKTYPDDERFCESDGTALATSAGAGRTVPMAEAETAETPVIQCPECGGRAEPGETICNYCGTRLAPDPAPPPSSAGTVYTGAAAQPSRPGTGRVNDPSQFAPSYERDAGFTDDPNYPEHDWEGDSGDQPAERRGVMGALGYIAAALVALAIGAGLAIYLSMRHETPPQTVAEASPSPSPSVAAAPAGPLVALASNMQIQVKSPDLAAALQRDPGSARTVFETDKPALLDNYKSALGGDASLHDGMVVRLSVNPDGSVASGGVIISTATNPSLDAEVVSTMASWKFPPVGGGPVNIDYPIIFAANPGDVAGIESDLNTRIASIGPNEVPEYTSAPAPAPTPPVVASLPSPPAPAVVPPPAPVPPPPVAPPPVTSRPQHHHRPAPPKPSLTDEVRAALSASRRTHRVLAYAAPGGVVTLSGSVFDEKDKAYAERTVRNVRGVTMVIDDLTVQTAQWAMNQDRIQQELQNAGLTGVTVRVIGSDAYLDGTVKTDLDKQRAVTITMSAAPVHVRGNLIRVVPGNIFGF